LVEGTCSDFLDVIVVVWLVAWLRVVMPQICRWDGLAVDPSLCPARSTI
jgi:hypothetical protein